MDKVVRLPAHERMTPEECIAFCGAEAADNRHVLVVAEDKNGRMVVRSSAMSRSTALWLAMFAADDVRGLIDWCDCGEADHG